MRTDDDNPPLPDDMSQWPPAAYGAGVPVEDRPSYTKLRDGAWGLRIPGGAREGDHIMVRKRDGSERAETVGRIVWTGNDRTTGKLISLAFIVTGRPYVAPKTAAKPAAKPAPAAKRKPAPAAKRPGSGRRPSGDPVAPRSYAAIIARAPESDQEPVPPRCGSPYCNELPEVDGYCPAHMSPRVRRALDVNDRSEAERTLGLDEPLF